MARSLIAYVYIEFYLSISRILFGGVIISESCMLSTGKYVCIYARYVHHAISFLLVLDDVGTIRDVGDRTRDVRFPTFPPSFGTASDWQTPFDDTRGFWCAQLIFGLTVRFLCVEYDTEISRSIDVEYQHSEWMLAFVSSQHFLLGELIP